MGSKHKFRPQEAGGGSKIKCHVFFWGVGSWFAQRNIQVNMFFLLTVFGVGVSCCILYSFVGYLYVSCSGSITSITQNHRIRTVSSKLPGA